MNIEMVQSVLGWCTVINVGLLFCWFVMFWLAHDMIFRFHGKMFRISVESFDSIHYAGLAVYKIGIFIFNLVPYWDLLIVRQHLILAKSIRISSGLC